MSKMIFLVALFTLCFGSEMIVKVCEEGGAPYCEWAIRESWNTLGSVITHNDACDPLTSFVAFPVFAEWISNKTGTILDIGYDRLWTQEKTFSEMANMTALFSNSKFSPIAV